MKGLSDKTTKDALQSYMEVVSGVEVLTVEFGDQGCALVRFSEAYGKFKSTMVFLLKSNYDNWK